MGRIEKFKDQSYRAIRRKHIESKDLFEDPLFPANDHSLSVNKPLGGTVVWKRPSVSILMLSRFNKFIIMNSVRCHEVFLCYCVS